MVPGGVTGLPGLVALGVSAAGVRVGGSATPAPARGFGGFSAEALPKPAGQACLGREPDAESEHLVNPIS